MISKVYVIERPAGPGGPELFFYLACNGQFGWTTVFDDALHYVSLEDAGNTLKTMPHKPARSWVAEHPIS